MSSQRCGYPAESVANLIASNAITDKTHGGMCAAFAECFPAVPVLPFRPRKIFVKVYASDPLPRREEEQLGDFVHACA